MVVKKISLRKRSDMSFEYEKIQHLVVRIHFSVVAIVDDQTSDPDLNILVEDTKND